jgi:two-component system alkaline phosphatase synthesis response regulator PhoP
MPQVYFAHDQQESPTPRRLALELAGYKVKCFASGVALLEALALELPELVVLDVLLEGQNGFEVCRALRAKYKAASLPVILSTPIYRSPEYREVARQAGAQEYLLRPCQPEELVTLVNQLLAAGQGSRRDRAA